jgi:serine/threonine protein kinase
MDSQGAGFAFDATMDFSNVFAAPQQTFSKPEDNTSGFFFGDEGIDTTTAFSQIDTMNPALLSTPQLTFDMQQSLVSLVAMTDRGSQLPANEHQTMDNTSGSASDWNHHLTPNMHNALSTFPPTPTQSFDSMYQQSTVLGKRPMQLDAYDFPQAKRHETTDFTLFPMDTSSSWTLETQSTPPSSIELGLPDEAADVCAMWFNKYNVLPSDRHIESLSQLTGESADAIRSWFGRLLKQGMGGSQSDSAYKSQTALIQQHDPFWDNQYSTNTLQASPPQLPSRSEAITTSEASCGHENRAVAQPTTSLRGNKKRCTPTEDRQLLARDPSKIYQCTRKCGKRYGRKCDWKRNEEEGYPCKSWICSLCKGDGVENVKPCFRKYHFVQHFRNIHPDLNAEEYEEASVVCSDTEFPRQCGFCRHRFASRQDRIDHIADHFKQGKCMLDWNDGDVSDADDTDDNDNDDDDRPSGDGFDGGKPSYQPPQSDPRGDAGSKHYGGGGSSSGSGGEPPQGGFFQFQLSQSEEDHSERRPSIADHRIKPTGDDRQQSQHAADIGKQCLLHSQTVTAAGDDQNIVARDDVPKLATEQSLSEQRLITSTEQSHVVELLDTKSFRISSEQSSPTKLVSSMIIPFTEENGAIWPGSELEQRQVSTEGANGALESIAPQQADSPPLLSVELRRLLTASTETPTSLVQTGLLPEVSQLESSNVQPIMAELSSMLDNRTGGLLQSIPTASQSFFSIKLLGSGGFSTVDEVIHRDTKLRVGRKTLKNRDSTAIEELRKEVNVLQKLRHPHVIRFLGAYSKGDKMSILLSPVAETTLALWLERSAAEKPANLAETVVKMFGCLASSVRYLHEQRPVVKHMDIKPQNILIVEGEQEFPHVVLSDFGVSSADELTDTQTAPITRQYIAPEVFNSSPRKQAADIWSLGCVLAEMASVPFGEDNTAWLKLRKDFSGRTGKNYWQDVAGVQDHLSTCLEEAVSITEQTVVRTLKTMLSDVPAERPTAASLTLVFTPAPCCLNWPNDKATFPGPHDELDGVEMLVHQDGVDCPVQLPSHDLEAQQPIAELSSAKSWLDKCLHSHEACHQQSSIEDKSLPTRLIDIRPGGQLGSSVRIVDGAAIESKTDSIEYIALSYIWGHQRASLTTERLADMQTELPLHLLPQAVTKAITVAQSLGYQYIWVDSLCILQDSHDEKLRECKAMASVFRNATLTITCDQLPGDRLPEDVDKLSTSSNAHVTASSHSSRLSVSAGLAPIDFSAPGFGWDTRAWVLQERLLSRRFLHLGEQMYWECNTLKASETFPHGLSPLVWEKVHSKSTEAVRLPSNKHRAIKSTTTIVQTIEGLQAPLNKPRATNNINPPRGKHEKHPRQLAPSRLRDCQWIKKEGDGIGDSIRAAHTSLQFGGVKASSNANVNHCACSTSTPSRLHPIDRQLKSHFNTPDCNMTTDRGTSSTHDDRIDPVSRRSAAHTLVIDHTPATSTTTSTPPSRSTCRSDESGRKEICESAQLDQHAYGRTTYSTHLSVDVAARDRTGNAKLGSDGSEKQDRVWTRLD